MPPTPHSPAASHAPRAGRRRGIFPNAGEIPHGYGTCGLRCVTLHVERFVEHLLDAEQDLAREARAFRQSIPAFIRESSVAALLTTPVIYSVLPVFLVLDLWVTLYQWICFPVYGIARVPRRRYFVVDRHRLGYLNGIEKVNCVYCGYANGVVAYVREVTSRTEQYWCPIKHARPVPSPHSRYRRFFDYGDGRAYRRDLRRLRRDLRPVRRKA